MIIKKSLFKKIFKKAGVQLSETAYKLLEEDIERMITRWAKRAAEGNIKRVMPGDIHLIRGNIYNKEYK